METTVITDIGEYEENVLAGMTMRQLVLSAAGILLIVISYMGGAAFLPMQAASYLAIGLGLPCFLFAYAHPHKMRLEKFIAIWVECELLSHRKRWYIAENVLYEAITKNDIRIRKGKNTHGTVETKTKQTGI